MLDRSTAVILIAAYASIFLVVILQVVQVFRGQNKRMSFQTGFNAFVALWSLLRIAYWVLEQSQPLDEAPVEMVVGLTSFAPMVQFAAFSLLVLFFVKMVSGEAWLRWRRSLFRPAWAGLNGVLFLFTCIWVPVFSRNVREGDIDYQDWDDRWQTYLLASYFTSLVVAFLALVKPLRSLGRRPRRSRPRHMPALTASLACIFLSRSLYDIFFAAHIGIGSRPLHTRPILALVGYASWEVLPTVILLVSTYTWRPRSSMAKRLASSRLGSAQSPSTDPMKDILSGSSAGGPRSKVLATLSQRLLGDSISSMASDGVYGDEFDEEEADAGGDISMSSAVKQGNVVGSQPPTLEPTNASWILSGPHGTTFSGRGLGSWRGGAGPAAKDAGRRDTEDEGDAVARTLPTASSAATPTAASADGADAIAGKRGSAATPSATAAATATATGAGTNNSSGCSDSSGSTGSGFSRDPDSYRRAKSGSSRSSRREIAVL